MRNRSKLTQGKVFSILNQPAISSKQRRQDTLKHLNKFIADKHSVMSGHKANKLVWECKGNSTVSYHAVHMLLGLAAPAMGDLEPHNYQTVFCFLSALTLLPCSDKVTICIGFSLWTNNLGLAIISDETGTDKILKFPAWIIYFTAPPPPTLIFHSGHLCLSLPPTSPLPAAL